MCWISKSATLSLSTSPPPKKDRKKAEKRCNKNRGSPLCDWGRSFRLLRTQSFPYLHFLGFHRSGESAERARVPQLNLGDVGSLPRDPHFTIKCPKNNSRLRRGNGPRRRGPSRSHARAGPSRCSEGRAGEPAGPREATSPLFMELLTAQSTQAASALLFSTGG